MACLCFNYADGRKIRHALFESVAGMSSVRHQSITVSPICLLVCLLYSARSLRQKALPMANLRQISGRDS